jgi:hypothetical protein
LPPELATTLFDRLATVRAGILEKPDKSGRRVCTRSRLSLLLHRRDARVAWPRADCCVQQGPTAAHHVVTDQVLHEMVRLLPRTREEFVRIEGMGV